MITAVVPFRGGSKGCPGKNVRLVAGKPLWRWSVDAALESELVDVVVVTTDIEEALVDAHALGCAAVRRPAELATDTADLDVAIRHAIDALGLNGTLVTLQPTVPVRPRRLIDDCVLFFERFPSAKSLVTVNRLHFVWAWSGGHGHMLNPPRVNRQEMPLRQHLYHEDGAVFVSNIKDFRKAGTRVIEPVVLYETDRTVDIDTEADLELAEFLLAKRRRADS